MGTDLRTGKKIGWAAAVLLLCTVGAASGAVMPVHEHLAPVTQGLSAPTGVAYDGSENLYVTESSRDRVSVFGGSGELLRSTAGVQKPISIGVGADGKVYVGNDELGAVEVLSAELEKEGMLGSGAGEFRHPTGVGVDGSGNVYVCDGKEDRVEVFGADRALKFGFGGTGSGPGQFTGPTALTVWEEGGELYVADQPVAEGEGGSTAGVRIQVFDLEGHYRRSFGTFGQGDGFLVRPAGVAVDAMGRVYVTDSYQNVVQVFDGEGVFLGTLYDTAQPFRTPLGIDIGRETGRVAVASLFGGKVEIYRVEVPVAHRITVEVTGEGEVEPRGPVVMVEDGGVVEFRVTAGVGYHVEGAKVDGEAVAVEGDRVTVGDVRGDRRLEVVFAKDPDPEPVVWTVTARVEGGGGTITPSGAVEVIEGGEVVFTLTAQRGYRLKELRVDGVGVEVTAESRSEWTYRLGAVSANHEVVGAYEIRPALKNVWEIIARAGEHGKIVPSGTVSVEEGKSQRFGWEAQAGYRVDVVKVDGKVVSASGEGYTFSAVRGEHEIEVTFRAGKGQEGMGASSGEPQGGDGGGVRFVENGDGTVTDTETGLMWQKDASCARVGGGGVESGGRGELTWEEGLRWVRGFNAGGEAGGCAKGYMDWRLPNVNELRSLASGEYAEATCAGGGCETVGEWLEAQGFGGVGEGVYWTSTSRVGTGGAWAVGFGGGEVEVLGKESTGKVWLVRTSEGGLEGRRRPVWKTGQEGCYGAGGEARVCEGTGQDGEVRSGLSWPAPRFRENGDGTVTDVTTGLVWLMDYGCLGVAGAGEAAVKVAGLNASPEAYRGACRGYTGSYGDWAMPSWEEKLGMTDYSQEEPSLPAGPWVGVEGVGYWSQRGGRAERAPWESDLTARHLWPVRSAGSTP